MQLLSVAQELLDADEAGKEFKLSKSQWQEVQAVRESIAKGAKTYTREEAREMILNKEKRDGLSAWFLLKPFMMLRRQLTIMKGSAVD